MILKHTSLALAVVASCSILTACGSDNNSSSSFSTKSTLSSDKVATTTMNFNRVASFAVCQQLIENCNTDTTTAAEIVSASTDGNTVIYTDSPADQIGFVDISNANQPSPLGFIKLAGEPTSITVKGELALVAVNTSSDYINVDGQLDIVDIATQNIIHSIPLNGQPDSIAISPDGNYVAVVIENERDEDLADGTPPQLPAGELIIVNTADADVANWTTQVVALTGIAELYSDDPEPEYVDINSNNVAIVSLQENNHLILVDLTTGQIINDFSAGSVDLTQIDLTEGKPLKIAQTESQTAVLREPDGVSWINNEFFTTANEGDLDGGSRGFSIFNLTGEVVFDSGNTLDHLAAKLGHYPDKRSGNKGNEPENVEMGVFDNIPYLFVNSERSSLVFVYDVTEPTQPELKQILPTAAGPEGALAIPERNLLVVASEEDSRGDKLRSALNLYQYQDAPARYPSIMSADTAEGTPIPWGAMSGLAADPIIENTLYAIEDSFYQANRIFTIDVSNQPAIITQAMTITDTNDVFANFATTMLSDENVGSDDVNRLSTFDNVDLTAMINADKSINIDPEGIAKAEDGGYWLASEGNGTQGDVARPINSLNFIFKLDANANIENVITLPDEVNAQQLRFGFEGITEYNGQVYVAMQRAWGAEQNPRIGIYNPITQGWSFVYYPLDTVESQNGGWVGLSDITSIGEGEFLVLERDNQAGPDAEIKRLYKIDLNDQTKNSTVTKMRVRDLMPDLAATNALTFEKIEGSAVTANGDVYIINDNDGVDDNSGETQLINLGRLSL